VVKPASPTAWLAHRMVEDIVKADVLPSGAISIICGQRASCWTTFEKPNTSHLLVQPIPPRAFRSHANVRVARFA